MAFLVFQLRAPLASFGSSQGALRLSDRQPRKSVVTGLLAAALGIERHQHDRFTQLSQQVNLAVCTLKAPRESADLHTVQTPVNRTALTRRQQLEDIKATGSTSAGIFSSREFLQDGHWLVALHGPADVLNQWRQALDQPKFTLYLGRKAFVLSAYTAPLVVDAAYVEDAMQGWAAQAPGLLPSLPATADMQWDQSMPTRCAVIVQSVRRDVRTNLMRNHFAGRTQYEGVAAFENKED